MNTNILSILSLYLTNREKTTLNAINDYKFQLKNYNLNQNQRYLEDDLIDINKISIQDIRDISKIGHWDNILKIKLDKENLNAVLSGASEGGHLDIVKYIESKGANTWNMALIQASLHGHLDIVKYAESKGANYWDCAIKGASLGGYLDIVKYSESKGANDWNWALNYASLNGHLDIVKYSESKGANNWNDALHFASLNDHLDIIKYAKSKGAN